MIPESSPPICPTCQAALARRPKAKTKCRACGAFIYVRSVPEGGRLLVKEADLATIEARRAAAPRKERAQETLVGIVGEGHRNADGTDRQALIRDRARVGDRVQLVPEPGNPYDRHAIKVCLESGEQIGYLERELARELSQEHGEGWRHAATIARVTGGTLDKPSRGIVLWLVSGPPGIAEADFAAAVEKTRTAPDRWDREPPRKGGSQARIELSFPVPPPARQPARGTLRPMRDTEPDRRATILVAVVALSALALAGAAWVLFVR